MIQTIMVIAPQSHSIDVVMVVSGTKYAQINPTYDNATPGRIGRTEPMIPMTPHRRAIMVNSVSIHI